MDQELRDSFKDMREGMERSHGRLEGRLDDVASAMHEHFTSDAANFQRIGDTATAIHRRVDEHLLNHQNVYGHWIQIVIGLLLTAAGVAAAMFR